MQNNRFDCNFSSFEQSPRKVTAGATIDGASPSKMFKPNMEQTKDDEGFLAIKSAPTMEFDAQLEPLLRENPTRFVIFPIKYHDIWEMYKKVTTKHVMTCLRHE